MLTAFVRTKTHGVPARRVPDHQSITRSMPPASLSAACMGCRRFRLEPRRSQGNGCAGAGGPGQQAGVATPEWLRSDPERRVGACSCRRACAASRRDETAQSPSSGRLPACRCRGADAPSCACASKKSILWGAQPTCTAAQESDRAHRRTYTYYCGACMEAGAPWTLDRARARARQLIACPVG